MPIGASRRVPRARRPFRGRALLLVALAAVAALGVERSYESQQRRSQALALRRALAAVAEAQEQAYLREGRYSSSSALLAQALSRSERERYRPRLTLVDGGRGYLLVLVRDGERVRVSHRHGQRAPTRQVAVPRAWHPLTPLGDLYDWFLEEVGVDPEYRP